MMARLMARLNPYLIKVLQKMAQKMARISPYFIRIIKKEGEKKYTQYMIDVNGYVG